MRGQRRPLRHGRVRRRPPAHHRRGPQRRRRGPHGGGALTTARVAVVVVSWNGAEWLPGLLASLAAQTRSFDRLIVVDNGSRDESVTLARAAGAELLELGANRGFAVAANAGFAAAADCDVAASVNTDVVLDPDWLARMVDALLRDPRRASVACKMVDLADRGRIYDAGDRLRRDGVCEQRGRFHADDGRFDAPGEAWGACAGAAVYRPAAVATVGGFDERFFSYLEDADLALRLRLAGWTCGYEPVVAAHAGEGSSWQLARPPAAWVQRNTLLLVAKAFRLRWLPLVAYRQLAWARAARRAGTLRAHLRGTAAAVPALPAAVRERRRLRATAVVRVQDAVPRVPIRRAAGAEAPPPAAATPAAPPAPTTRAAPRGSGRG